MKKIAAVIFALLCSFVASQEMKFTESTGEELTSSAPLVPLFGYKEVYVSFFTFLGEADEMKMDLKYEDTDPSNTYPVSFSIQDGSGSEIMIRDYMSRNSLSEISYYTLIEEGIQNYFTKMTNGKLDLDIKFLKNPTHSQGVWEVEELRSYYKMLLQPEYGIGEAVYKGHMVDRLKTFGDGEIMGIVAPQGTLNETVFLNFLAEPIVPLSNGRSLGGVAPGNDSYTWVGDAINQNIAILTHELAHTCFALMDNGFDGAASNFYGYIDNIFMGRSGSQTGPYCLMHHNQVTFGPYSMYGINSVHTQSLYHQGYFDNTEYEVLDENFINDDFNKATIKLKSVRDKTDDGIKRFVVMPIRNDNNDPLDKPTIGSMTEAQHFLIEYRNGKGHDNIACINESGNSKGVIISHIINTDAMQTNYYSPCIDIEIASPYQKYWSNGEDLYRNPDSTSSNQTSNGMYYNGKDCPDWLDDYNYNDYLPQGGMGAWPYPFGEHSLPTDFFNDTDRNKFTPSTRPSSCSWKMKDTHIGVYIDNIDYENDYADLRIYRNYWSLPLTEEYLAFNNDGKSVVGLDDYCYFGDNFSVDPGIQIWLGNGTEEMKATLVPGTDMVMKENSLLMFANNTKLRLEDSKLTFLSCSKYQPNDIADIELVNSELNFNDGFVFCPLGEENLNRFDINVSGNSAIYNSDLELINNSLLIIRENSELVLKGGTNLRIPASANLILADGAELIVDSGANISIEPGSVIAMGVGAKITLREGVALTLDMISINGQEYNGFVAENGSSLVITNSTFPNAHKVVTAVSAYVAVLNSVFTDCSYGLDITSCSNFDVNNNMMSGVQSGYGVSVVQSGGFIRNNNIKNFFRGVNVVSCSPTIYHNVIHNNARNGLVINGYNSKPVMTDGEILGGIDLTEPNNEFFDNGFKELTFPVPTVIAPSQISIVNYADIYIKYCRNNVIYNGEIPCINAAKLLPLGTFPIPQLIDARGNYWGGVPVTSDYFIMNDGYYIDYTDSSTVEFGSELFTSPMPVPESKSYEELLKALQAEIDGKYDKAIHFYEKIIEKYPESEEAVVAYTRLPDSYLQEGLSLDPVIVLYESNLNVTDDKLKNKFFREMKVTANLKSRKYDEAIEISQDMLTEAESEEEKILCEIDIAIANMLKNTEGKGRNASNSTDISALLEKLTGGENKGESADITDVVLPLTSRLYQNYPNPFNPVTQIRFDLTKTEHVKLSVYNISGQKVAELTDGVMNAGRHSVEFDGSSLNSGIYYYTIETDGMTLSKRMLLMK